MRNGTHGQDSARLARTSKSKLKIEGRGKSSLSLFFLFIEKGIVRLGELFIRCRIGQNETPHQESPTMSAYAIPSALAFAINLTLCLIVFLDNPKGMVNRVFTLLILSFVAWNAGELIMINSDLHSMALVGVKVIFAGVFLFPGRRQKKA
mgnify:CR=1 FL=1